MFSPPGTVRCVAGAGKAEPRQTPRSLLSVRFQTPAWEPAGSEVEELLTSWKA